MAKASRSQHQPGLLNQKQLTINRNKHSPKETEVLKRILGDQQMLRDREFTGRMFVCAVLNVYALILYRIGNQKEAIKTWEKTLEKDPTNLNAIKDLITINNTCKLNKHQSKKYKQLLKNATETRSDKKVQLSYARSQAEQAYAGFCDLQTKAWDNSEARSEQIKQFEEALIRGEGIISEEERRDWLLYTGQAHEKLARSQFKAGLNHPHQNSLKDDYVKSIENAYSHLWNCLQISEEPMHKAQAWCAIGNTFAQKQRRQDVLKRLVSNFPGREKELTNMITNPRSCYKKALNLDEANKVWILARLGICLFNDGYLEEAMDAFNKSINAAEKLPDHDPMKKACRLAYERRAVLYIKKAETLWMNFSMHKRNYLNMARSDTEKALQISFHPNPLATFGDVHYRLAKLEEDEGKKADLLETALIHLRKSFDCQDGKSIPFTHITAARCHVYMENYLSATEHYQEPLKQFKSHKDQGSNVIKLRAMVAQELLHLTLKWWQNHENAIDVVNRLKLTLPILGKGQMQPAIFKLKRKGYMSDLLRILLQAMEQHPNSHGDFIGSCLECICNIQHLQRLRENELELLNELSYDYQQWKVCPPIAEADMSSTTQAQPQNALNNDFVYDYYVISNDTDQLAKDWVHHTLLPQLKKYGLKGYSHDKDSRLGELDTDAQAKAMQNSCYICAVITQGFNDNHQCLLQVEMACKSSAPGKVFTVQLQNAKVPPNLKHCECFDFTGQHDMERLAQHMSTEGLTMEE